MLADLRPDVAAYFAENQSTADGLSSHILNAMYRAAGLICVMHQRGGLSLPGGESVKRGSIWIEQEIAIVAFMNHILSRTLPVLFYKEQGVTVEGMRSVLLMNPRVEFDHESRVLDDLRLILPSMNFVPFSNYDLEPVLSYRRLQMRGNADHHVYEFKADIRNVGSECITDFEMRVYFPRAFLDRHTAWGAEDRNKSTPTHICFVANEGRSGGRLYTGDQLRNPLTIEYFVNHELDDDPTAMQSEIVVDLFSGSMKPKRAARKIREFQEF